MATICYLGVSLVLYILSLWCWNVELSRRSLGMDSFEGEIMYLQDYQLNVTSNYWTIALDMQALLNFTGRKRKQRKKSQIFTSPVRLNYTIQACIRTQVWFHTCLLLLKRNEGINSTSPSTRRRRKSGRVSRWKPHVGEICESNRIKSERRRKCASKEQMESTLKVNRATIRISRNEVARQSAFTINCAQLEVFSL